MNNKLELFLIGWKHPIEKKTLTINKLEHVLDRNSRSTFPEHALARMGYRDPCMTVAS